MARIGGGVKEGDASAGEVFRQRLKRVREQRGWTQTQLAHRLKDLGHPIHRVRLAKLESDPAKAARVSLEDVLAICYALDVSPLYMFVPLERQPRLLIVGAVQPSDPADARAWLRGVEPLLGQDPRVFTVERPVDELAEAMERAPITVVQELQRSWRVPDRTKED